MTTQYSYGPYGSISITGTTNNSYTYTGRETDGLGLYYLRARYYNPQIGRFISADPSGFMGGLNVYAYVADDPLNFIDPLGLDKNTPSDQKKHPFKCASELANKYSLANLLGIDTQGTGFWDKLGTAFLGNTISGISDFLSEMQQGDGAGIRRDVLLGGVKQGVPGGGKSFFADGIVGVITDTGVDKATEGEILSIAGAASEEGLAAPVGVAKFGIDTAIYTAAYEYCVNHQ